MTTERLVFRQLVVVCAAAVALASCGSSDDGTKESATRTSPAPSSVPTPEPEPVDECEAKGVSATENTGRCTGEDRVERIVVRRAGTVRLYASNVRLVKSYVSKDVPALQSAGAPSAKAQGRFVIFKFRVENIGSAPQSWPSGFGWASLEILGRTYTPDEGVAAFTKGYTVDGNPGLESGELQAGQTKTAWVAFDVKTTDAAALRSKGSILNIVSGSDAQNGNNAAAGTAGEQGTIQLWR